MVIDVMLLDVLATGETQTTEFHFQTLEEYHHDMKHQDAVTKQRLEDGIIVAHTALHCINERKVF